jgi:hypothetical protein
LTARIRPLCRPVVEPLRLAGSPTIALRALEISW